MINILEPNFRFEDDRGSLVQLVREGYKQINVIHSVKGCVRGGHYHEQNVEAFYVIKGAIKLLVSKDGSAESYKFKSGDMFSIEPYVVHNFEFIEETLLVSMYDKGVELPDGSKDILS